MSRRPRRDHSGLKVGIMTDQAGLLASSCGKGEIFGASIRLFLVSPSNLRGLSGSPPDRIGPTFGMAPGDFLLPIRSRRL